MTTTKSSTIKARISVPELQILKRKAEIAGAPFSIYRRTEDLEYATELDNLDDSLNTGVASAGTWNTIRKPR